jgi:hypothetical protein
VIVTVTNSLPSSFTNRSELISYVGVLTPASSW